MTETTHIFDEFSEIDCEHTPPEVRHQKRMKLEPLIFDVLKKKYGKALDEYWNTVGPSIHPDKCVLLVERRVHENIEFCIKNAAYFGKGWSIGIVCSEKNIEYCKAIAGKQVDKVHFLPFFRGSPTREQARDEYSGMLKDAHFYKSLPWKNVLILQTDSYLRKSIPEEVLEYDFISAPATWDMSAMVGGLSFRNRDAMIRLCTEFKEDIASEDVYLDSGSKKLDLRRPNCYKAMEFIAESCLYEDPVGVHQWWTYFCFHLADANEVFHTYLTLEII